MYVICELHVLIIYMHAAFVKYAGMVRYVAVSFPICIVDVFRPV